MDQDTGNSWKSGVFLMPPVRRTHRFAEATRRTGNKEEPEGILEGAFMAFAMLDGMC